MKQYYITDRVSAGGFGPLFEIVQDQIELGVDMIQIRDKECTARELFEFSLAVMEARGKAATKIVINTRGDIARAVGADGVHLPANAPVQTLHGLLVGRSCHTLEDVKNAHAQFVTFGPVFASPGKGDPTGIEQLRQACQAGTEVFALGGVNWENAEECMNAGAVGIAGIRLFQDADL